MPMRKMTENPTFMLKNAKTILLVDWPGPDVPRSLVSAGFKVFSYSPGSYCSVSLKAGSKNLLFTNTPDGPGQVDIVNIFRPEEEHPTIITQHVLPLKAKVLWLHPPVTSAKTAALARESGLVFIEGIDIAAMANELSVE